MLTSFVRIGVVLSLALGVLGCGDDTTNGSSGPDLAMSIAGGDMAHAGGGGDMAKSSSGDGGTTGALCDVCTQNSDCASGTCMLYNNGTKHCTRTCTQASDCPNGCNNMTPAVCRCP